MHLQRNATQRNATQRNATQRRPELYLLTKTNNYLKFYIVLFLARFNDLCLEVKDIINKFFSLSLYNKNFYFWHKEILKSSKTFCIGDFIL